MSSSYYYHYCYYHYYVFFEVGKWLTLPRVAGIMSQDMFSVCSVGLQVNQACSRSQLSLGAPHQTRQQTAGAVCPFATL